MSENITRDRLHRLATCVETIDGTPTRIGKPPSMLDADDFSILGHEHQPILDVVRAKCLDCCGNAPSEVRRCTSYSCPLWPYRMGGNPLRAKREMTDEQREAAKARLAAARAARG